MFITLICFMCPSILRFFLSRSLNSNSVFKTLIYKSFNKSMTHLHLLRLFSEANSISHWPNKITHAHFVALYIIVNIEKTLIERFNITASSLKCSVWCAAAVQIAVLYFCLFLDLQCYNLIGYHGLKTHYDGILLQWIYKDPWQADMGGWKMTYNCIGWE